MNKTVKSKSNYTFVTPKSDLNKRKIIGSKWMSDTHESRVEIEFKDLIEGSCFTMKSDLAESIYTFYVDRDNE